MIRLNKEVQLRLVSFTKILARFLGVISVISGLMVKLPDEKKLSLSQNNFIFSWFFENLWWILTFVLVALPFVEWLRRWAEAQTLWPIVKSILEDFKSSIYPQAKDEPEYFHRVTLFRRSSWVLRWRALKSLGLGWLYIVERTGYTTQNSRTIFRAPNDPDRAEGMAGNVWVSNKMLFTEDLPDLSADGWREEVSAYALHTKCPVGEVIRRRPKSRSLCGIPVEVKGRVWGVLVVDSRRASLPKENITAHYSSASKYLSRILERI